GVTYIQVPTSLLAQIDSSIGGKVAIDMPEGKNLVGSFYHPAAVFIDPNLLDTLPTRFFNDGMAEVIKYGCIRDGSLFNSLETYKSQEMLRENIEKIIFTCLDIKREVVEGDQWDRGNRMILNFGHTLGHAIESYFQYGNYTHGEAVAIGMYQITKASEQMGLTKEGTALRIKNLLSQHKLPYKMPSGDIYEIIEGIAVDKKSKGLRLNIVLLVKIGKCFIRQVNHKDIHKYFME
ncbi:MAG TPA: 3-dehydroquinate synthase family protein, partial [Clostridia bacterium]|nr:3-dehydroquinate synthase family protein [Clostridia bacterium]